MKALLVAALLAVLVSGCGGDKPVSGKEIAAIVVSDGKVPTDFGPVEVDPAHIGKSYPEPDFSSAGRQQLVAGTEDGLKKVDGKRSRLFAMVANACGLTGQRFDLDGNTLTITFEHSNVVCDIATPIVYVIAFDSDAIPADVTVVSPRD